MPMQHTHLAQLQCARKPLKKRSHGNIRVVAWDTQMGIYLDVSSVHAACVSLTLPLALLMHTSLVYVILNAFVRTIHL